MANERFASTNGGVEVESSSNNKGYENDMFNPHITHPSDNPATAIVTPPLNGSTYHTWSRSMMVALRSTSLTILTMQVWVRLNVT